MECSLLKVANQGRLYASTVSGRTLYRSVQVCSKSFMALQCSLVLSIILIVRFGFLVILRAKFYPAVHVLLSRNGELVLLWRNLPQFLRMYGINKNLKKISNSLKWWLLHSTMCRTRLNSYPRMVNRL